MAADVEKNKARSFVPSASKYTLALAHSTASFQVLIERVRSPAIVAREASGTPALEVSFQVHFGGNKLLCETFVARCRENPAAVLERSSIPSTSPMAIPDTQTAVFALEEVCDSGTQPGAAGASALRPSSERSVVPARPLKDIELPYKSYRVRPVRLLLLRQSALTVSPHAAHSFRRSARGTR